MRKNLLKRLSGIFLCVLMLICALYIPMGIFAENDRTTEVFSFSDAVSSNTENKKAAEEKGVGYFGWSTIVDNGRLNLTENDTTKSWATVGGIRLNNTNGVFYLEPSSSYIVSMNIKVMGSPVKTQGGSNENTALVSLGYGAKYNPAAGGNANNYVNTMEKTLQTVINSVTASDTYTLTVGENSIDLPYSNEAIAYSCYIETPEDFGNLDRALTIWCKRYYGFACEIDDVTVTKLSTDESAVIMLDRYSAKCDVVVGKIGEAVTLSDISDRATNSDHKFLGWYKDSNFNQSAEDLVFGDMGQTVFSKWESTVKYTFKDSVNGKDIVVSGKSGSELVLPKDPVDPNGEQWFMGWYATADYSVAFSDKFFGFSDKAIYGLWKSQIPELYQDFEDYDKDEFTVETDSGGNKVKTNRNYFSKMMEKQSLVTFDNSGYAVKLTWDKSKTALADDPGSYDSATRYNQMDMYFWLGKGIENKQIYNVTFKYYVESADTDFRIFAASGIENNIWGQSKRYGFRDATVSFGISKNDAGKGWKDGSFIITTDFMSNVSNYMYLGVELPANENVTVYFDNVNIKAVAQPYESFVTLYNNNGEANTVVTGKRGEEIKLPTPVNENGSKFLGWYSDSDCTVPFENMVFERENLTVYAKWSAIPFTFKDYAYSSSMGKTMSIVNETKIGNGDDYALKLNYDASDIYSVDANGKEVLMSTRYSQLDHSAVVADKIENGVAYKLSYDYKILSANVGCSVTPVISWSGNIWVSDYRTVYKSAKVKLNTEAANWQTAECYISAVIADKVINSSGVFLSVTMDNADETNKVELLIDNVLLEKITPPYIYFDGRNETDASIIYGKAGESISFPNNPKKSGYDFTGWYTDIACTIPFEGKMFTEGMELTVYAGYEKSKFLKNTFEDYAYSSSIGSTMSIVNEKGIGNGDDYALKFNYNASDVYKIDDSGNKQLMSTRYAQLDHSAVVADKIENGVVYKVSYDYKVLSSNVECYITPVISWASNIWAGDFRTIYKSAKVKLNKGSANWQTAECYISAVVADKVSTSSGIFLSVTVENAKETNKAQLLIDNVVVERIEPPFIYFDGQNDKDSLMVVGKAGENISFPANPQKFRQVFTGWYIDPECKEPFEEKEFTAGMGLTVYAGYKEASTVTINFEDYTLPTREEDPGNYYYQDAEVVAAAGAKSGKKVARFDRTKEVAAASGIVLAQGNDVFKVEIGKQYIVTLNYRVTKAISQNFTINITSCLFNNYWASRKVLSGTEVIPVDAELGKWNVFSFVLDTSVTELYFEGLYLNVFGGNGGIVDIDDVVIMSVPAGQSAVAVSRGGCEDLPLYLIGKEGKDFSNKLIKNPTVDNKKFIGYYITDTAGKFQEMKDENYVFSKNPLTVYARFYNLKLVQNFDTTYSNLVSEYKNFSIFDFDYEIYDSSALGNSKENVISGNNSLHRKGESQYFENAALLTLGNTLAEGQRYIVTMKVKIGKHFHTDGAIKIVSARNHAYSWYTTGDYYPIASIASVADGQWHEISYSFNAVEPYVSIQTPGYVEVFIDDVEFALTDSEKTELSVPVSFTEYVPAKRDKNGNIVEFVDANIDINTIIDASIGVVPEFNYMYVVVPGAAALFIIIGAVCFLLYVKKRKGGKK